MLGCRWGIVGQRACRLVFSKVGDVSFLQGDWWRYQGEREPLWQASGRPSKTSQLHCLLRKIHKCKWIKVNTFRNQSRDVSHTAGPDKMCLCNTNKKPAGALREYRLLVSQLRCRRVYMVDVFLKARPQDPHQQERVCCEAAALHPVLPEHHDLTWSALGRVAPHWSRLSKPPVMD